MVGATMWGKIGAVIVGLVVAWWYFQDSKLASLKGKRVLVTGASAGIGEQMAYHYASLGSKVAVTARRAEVLQKVTKRCTELSPDNSTHYAIPADMSDMEAAKHVIQQAVFLLGGLDILVLNHIMLLEIQPFTGSTENLTIFDKVTDVNFRSYVHLTSAAIPQLVANQGSIIVVNSLLGKVPHPWLAIYSASKHALHGFFESLRSQFIAQDQNVSVTSCTLGYIGTDNAIKQLEAAKLNGVLANISPASPSATALAIVTAGERRQDEMYYPYFSVRPVVFLRNIVPSFIDSLLRYIAKR